MAECQRQVDSILRSGGKLPDRARWEAEACTPKHNVVLRDCVPFWGRWTLEGTTTATPPKKKGHGLLGRQPARIAHALPTKAERPAFIPRGLSPAERAAKAAARTPWLGDI